jgi:hypothetical protein
MATFVACGMLSTGIMIMLLVVLVISALLIAGFLVATLRMGSVVEWLLPAQFGDSSLSRDSVNWLAVVAACAAFATCFLLT